MTKCKAVLDLLSENSPTSERQLKQLLINQGYSADTAERMISDAHSRNVIRWVAFEGWVRGGRP